VIVRLERFLFALVIPSSTNPSTFWTLCGRLRKRIRSVDWRVSIQAPQGWLTGRVCALQKSADAARKAQRKILRKAPQGGPRTKPETLEYARHVIVFTTLPQVEFPARFRTGVVPAPLANRTCLQAPKERGPPGPPAQIPRREFPLLALRQVAHRAAGSKGRSHRPVYFPLGYLLPPEVRG